MGWHFSRLKDKRLDQVSLIVADVLKGLKNQIILDFPEAKLQKCVTHKMRNVTKHVSPKHKQEMNQDLKHIFDNFTEKPSK